TQVSSNSYDSSSNGPINTSSISLSSLSFINDADASTTAGVDAVARLEEF
ncbi:6124_t:CDS:2, partial [Diversispora eburnea]